MAMLARCLLCVLLLALAGCMERDKPEPLPRRTDTGTQLKAQKQPPTPDQKTNKENLRP
jgi:hypothetical protein